MSTKLFNSLLVVAVLCGISQAQVDYDVVPTPGSGLNLIYQADTGRLDLMSDTGITTLELKSASGAMVGDKPASHVGLFDVYTPLKSFKLDPAGFTEIEGFATVGANMSPDALMADLSMAGAIVGGGSISAIAGGVHLVAVPEPSSMVLIGLGLAGVLGLRRRR